MSEPNEQKDVQETSSGFETNENNTEQVAKDVVPDAAFATAPVGEPVAKPAQAVVSQPEPAPAYAPAEAAPSAPETAPDFHQFAAPDPATVVVPTAIPAEGAQTGGNKGVAPLILGILAIVLCAIPIVGIVLGVLAIVLGSKVIKQSGANGRANAGRICGIVGIVFALISYAASFAIMGAFNTVPEREAAGIYGSEAVVNAITDKELALAKEANQVVQSASVEKYLIEKCDLIVNQDPNFIAEIAPTVNERVLFGDSRETLSQQTIDPVRFCTAVSAGSSYEIGSISMIGIDTGLEDLSTASALITFTMKSNKALFDALDARIQNAADTGEFRGLGEDRVPEILNNLLEEVSAANTTMVQVNVIVSLQKEDGVWKEKSFLFDTPFASPYVQPETLTSPA